jgi:hypothetical protein
VDNYIPPLGHRSSGTCILHSSRLIVNDRRYVVICLALVHSSGRHLRYTNLHENVMSCIFRTSSGLLFEQFREDDHGPAYGPAGTHHGRPLSIILASVLFINIHGTCLTTYTLVVPCYHTPGLWSWSTSASSFRSRWHLGFGSKAQLSMREDSGTASQFIRTTCLSIGSGRSCTATNCSG